MMERTIGGRGRMLGVLSGVLAGAVLAGCGSPSSAPLAPIAGVAGTSSDAPVPPDASICPAGSVGFLQLERGAVHYDPTMTFETAFVCGGETRRVPGDGEWHVLVVSRVTGGLDELLTAYTEPDEPSTDGACTSEGVDPLVVYLQGDDGVVAVRAPQDDCGKPIDAAEPAYRALRLEPARETGVQQTKSQLALDSGCSDSWEAIGPPPDRGLFEQGSHARHPSTIGPGSAVCVYQLPDEKKLVTAAVGTLRAAASLTGPEAEGLQTALAKALVDRSCATYSHREFLLVRGAKLSLVLGPDGCVTQFGGRGVNGAWRLDGELYQALKAARAAPGP